MTQTDASSLDNLAPERRLQVSHQTSYHYPARVELAYHIAFLRPREFAWQCVESHRLQIDPPPSQHTSDRDSFGNSRDLFAFYTPHETLEVTSQSVVELMPRAYPDWLFTTTPWEELREAMRYRRELHYLSANEFIYPSPFVPLHSTLADYALVSFTPRRPLLDAAFDLMLRIHHEFEYATASTQINTPLLKAFQSRRGVCQDFAQIMIGCLRSIGLPARYVSGYLLTDPPPGQPRLIGADASHAWVSVYGVDTGWVDLDPTNGMTVDTSHVTVAIGRDYGDVTPVRGVIHGGGAHTLDVAVTVMPIDENPSIDQ